MVEVAGRLAGLWACMHEWIDGQMRMLMWTCVSASFCGVCTVALCINTCVQTLMQPAANNLQVQSLTNSRSTRHQKLVRWDVTACRASITDRTPMGSHINTSSACRCYSEHPTSVEPLRHLTSGLSTLSASSSLI